MQFKSIFLGISIALIFAFHAPAQEITVQRYSILKTQALESTDRILSDTGKLNETERALTLAYLGERWLKEDPDRASVWFERSVDSLFFSTPKTKDERTNFVLAVNEILKILWGRNAKQFARLESVLKSTDLDIADSDRVSDVLVDLAIEAAKKEPSMAERLTLTALRIGHPAKYYRVVWEFRRNKNPRAADQLVEVALLKAKTSGNHSIIQGLIMATLPEANLSMVPPELDSPRPVKLKVLEFLASQIIRSRNSLLAGLLPSCQNEALLIKPTEAVLSNLLPERAQIVSISISDCLRESSASVLGSDESSITGKSVEELRELAEKYRSDAVLRLAYLTRAAVLASQISDHQTVIDIVDKLSEEDRLSDAEFWEQMRYESAGRLAFEKSSKKEFAIALKVLEDTPDDLRPYARTIFLLQGLRKMRQKEVELEVFRSARKEFAKSGKPFEAKLGFWLQLVKIGDELQAHLEAAEIYSEIVLAHNNESDDKSTPNFPTSALTATFTAKLLDRQLQTIQTANDRLDAARSRINANLAILTVQLEALEQLKRGIRDKKLMQNEVS